VFNRLFTEAALQRTFSTLLQLFLDSLDDFDALHLNIKLLAHSMKKSLQTYMMSHPSNPASGPTVITRSGGQLPQPHNRYMNAAPGGDTVVARCAAGLQPDQVEFASLPPHFKVKMIYSCMIDYAGERKFVLEYDLLCYYLLFYTMELIVMLWNENELIFYQLTILRTTQIQDPPMPLKEIYKCMQCTKMPIEFRVNIPFLVASVVHHRCWLRNILKATDPLFKNVLFLPQNGEECLIDRWENDVVTGIDRCPHTDMKATGVPANVRFMLNIKYQFDSLKKNVEEMKGEIGKLKETNDALVSALALKSLLPTEKAVITPALDLISKDISDRVMAYVSTILPSFLSPQPRLEIASDDAASDSSEQKPFPFKQVFHNISLRNFCSKFFLGDVISDSKPYKDFTPRGLNGTDRAYISQLRLMAKIIENINTVIRNKDTMISGMIYAIRHSYIYVFTSSDLYIRYKE
jgi:hypothetical protein